MNVTIALALPTAFMQRICFGETCPQIVTLFSICWMVGCRVNIVVVSFACKSAENTSELD
jgi:hypothetical protein